jgi:hypothetical protein
MKTLRLAGFVTLTALAAACDDGTTTTTPDGMDGDPVVAMHGQVVNGRTGPVPAAKVVLTWGDFGAMFPPFGASVPLTGSFPAAFQFDLSAPPAADRLFNPAGGFTSGYFDPALESEIAIARILVVKQEADTSTFIPDADMLGAAEDFALVYAARAVAAGTAGAAYLGGPVAAGYHVVKVATNAARDAVYPAISDCQRQAADIAAWKACGIYTSMSVAPADATVAVRLVDAPVALDLRWLGPTFIGPGTPVGPGTCIPPMDPMAMPCPQQ